MVKWKWIRARGIFGSYFRFGKHKLDEVNVELLLNSLPDELIREKLKENKIIDIDTNEIIVE